ncbi:MAG: peptidase domain-containing ABC transporter [Muribaculum sp.]|nr:peptidase domain-containing ABC transporter [Muribaculum sp.]
MKTKFQFIRQYDSMQCGAASLTMVCDIFGKKISMAEAESLCGAGKNGVSMLALKNASNSLGLENVVMTTTTDELKSSPLPAILFWENKHFVVLYQISLKKNIFYIADPAKGLVKYSKEEFERRWINDESPTGHKGIAMFFNPTNDFIRSTNKKDTKKRSLKFLYDYFIEYHKYFAIIALGLIVGSLLQLIMPFLTQAIVDIGIKHNNLGLIWLILTGELMIVIGRTSTDFIRRWLILHISMRINVSLVSDFIIKLLKLPMSFFESKKTGDLLQRMGDHNRVQMFLTNQTLSVAFTFVNFFIFGIVLFMYNIIVFLIYFIGSIIYCVWIITFLNKRKIIDYELFDQQARNNNKTYQLITCMQEIKLQNCEQRRRWEWENVQADTFVIQMKNLKMQQTQEAGSIFINEIKNILITVFAAAAVIEGNMTLGAMLAVQFIVGQLNSPLEQLMIFIYSIQDTLLSLERIKNIHEIENEDVPNKQKNILDGNKSIKIINVSFKYNTHAINNTLENISIDIPAGTFTAIVGTSGSGKSTLIKLLLGYYKVSQGKILIGDEDINSYNLKWWRTQCGVVMQDGVIFSESIAQNIAVSDGDINLQQVENAAKAVNIHDFIMTLPLKYNTIIGSEGVGLSQGQKQRILIARAVYKNPDFIFLDEATNSLDAKNERAIVDNLAQFYQGRTVVVVAHRLSTVKNADQIIVVDGGRIVETGTHASLIDRRGAYYTLVKNQLELGN